MQPRRHMTNICKYINNSDKDRRKRESKNSKQM